MACFAIIVNGRVDNYAEASPEFAAEQGWRPAGNSRIGDLWAEGDVYTSPPPILPTVDDFHAWLYEHLDELAQGDRWDNRVTLMQRAAYPGIWQELALSFCAHVDLCEGAALQYLQSGQPLPASKAAFIAMLPAWDKP